MMCPAHDTHYSGACKLCGQKKTEKPEVTKRPKVLELADKYQREGASSQAALRSATYDVHRFDIEHANLSDPDVVRGFLLMLLDRTATL